MPTKPLPVFSLQALAEVVKQRRVLPLSAYRLQFHRGFTFSDATRIIPYLSALGVDAVYCSPYLKARPGSMHGYDICDHNQLNPELGDESAYAEFVAALRKHDIKQLLDVVPNHMVADPDCNIWWRDVLEHGQSSQFSRYFDIDWHPLKRELRGKLLIPLLGDHYGSVLERGELTLSYAEGLFTVTYAATSLPIDFRSVGKVLRTTSPFIDFANEANSDVRELLSIIMSCERMPAGSEPDLKRISERRRERNIIRERLQALTTDSPHIASHLQSVLDHYAGTVGDERSFDPLHELLEAQHYRISFWRTAVHEINYRRFFDVNDLVGVRVEEPDVREASHRKILQLVYDGSVSALRLDHIDGLFDPKDYVERLQRSYLHETALREFNVPWAEVDTALAGLDDLDDVEVSDLLRRPMIIFAEKVLGAAEMLEPSWPLHGTTGYDFLNEVNQLFVDQDGLTAITAYYRRHTIDDVECQMSLRNSVYDCKKLIMETSLAAELNVLAAGLNRLSEHGRHSRDYTLISLRKALAEMVACLPVYRTYITNTDPSKEDRKVINTALRKAARRNSALDPSIFTFLRSILLPEESGRTPAEMAERLRFTMKLQQYSGPVQAKGVEDTAFYRQNALLSLNEVGSDAERRSLSLLEFHVLGRSRGKRWPATLVTTSTHDTKRGEDTRMRLNVLTEIPERWTARVEQWSAQHRHLRTEVDGELAPSSNDEYLFYQTLVGMFPLDDAELKARGIAPDQMVHRLICYLEKATKEAKVHTSWINPIEQYDAALKSFAESILQGSEALEFLSSVRSFVQQIARASSVNGLSQLILKLTTPGVPDVYQGTELWDFSLVDPDNRRAVDFELRQELLSRFDFNALSGPQVNELLTHEVGTAKLFLLRQALHLRKALPSVFLEGTYLPLECSGLKSANAIAYLRVHQDQSVLVLAPRMIANQLSDETPLPIGVDFWGDTTLHLPEIVTSSTGANVLTGANFAPNSARGRNAETETSVGELLKDFPVGLIRFSQT